MIRLEQQHFGGPTGRLDQAQPGGQDPGGVDDQHVAGAQEQGQVADQPVGDPARRGRWRPEPGGVPGLERSLGDGGLWQVVVGHLHGG